MGLREDLYHVTYNLPSFYGLENSKSQLICAPAGWRFITINQHPSPVSVNSLSMISAIIVNEKTVEVKNIKGYIALPTG